jgi:hypothetical protein
MRAATGNFLGVVAGLVMDLLGMTWWPAGATRAVRSCLSLLDAGWSGYWM